MLKISQYHEKVRYQYLFTIIDSDTENEVMQLVRSTDHKIDDKEMLEVEPGLLSEAQDKIASRDRKLTIKQFPTKDI